MKQSLSSAAYEAIYRRIITLEYEPGERLEESRLVSELDIGRTPVREALMALASNLLVEAEPGKGFVVRPITLQSTRAAFAALSILEQGIATLVIRGQNEATLAAMEEANREMKDTVGQLDILRLVELNQRFHAEFAQASRNIYLVEALERVRCETNRLAYLSYSTEIEPMEALQTHYGSVVDQHDEIIRAIRDRDEKRLKTVLAQHSTTFKNRIITYLTA